MHEYCYTLTMSTFDKELIIINGSKGKNSDSPMQLINLNLRLSSLQQYLHRGIVISIIQLSSIAAVFIC